MKHTPGPWRTGSGSYRDECRVETENAHRHPQSSELGVKIESRYIICHCSEPEAGQGQANAKLISAVPELLEIVKALEIWYDASTDGKHAAGGPTAYSLLFEDERGLYEHIKDAVAKAEGRKP